MLYANPNALHLVSLFCPPKISWEYLSSNTNPNAIQLLREYIHNIHWGRLSENEAAIDILTDNQDKIVWRWLSQNPNAIPLLEKNIDKIDWKSLSENPNAIPLLEKHPDKISWINISSNEAIFEYDYVTLAKQRMLILEEELMMKALHPKRIQMWLENGLTIDEL
jgi:hypothetical protein